MLYWKQFCPNKKVRLCYFSTNDDYLTTSACTPRPWNLPGSDTNVPRVVINAFRDHNVSRTEHDFAPDARVERLGPLWVAFADHLVRVVAVTVTGDDVCWKDFAFTKRNYLQKETRKFTRVGRCDSILKRVLILMIRVQNFNDLRRIARDDFSGYWNHGCNDSSHYWTRVAIFRWHDLFSEI